MKKFISRIIFVLVLFSVEHLAQAQWIEASAPGASVQSLYSTGGGLYATTLFGAGIYVSGDNGTTWTPSGNGITGGIGATDVQSIVYHALNYTYYAGTGDGIFLSGDNGKTWTAVNTGLPANTFVKAIVSNGLLFAATSQGVIHSTNGGTSWAMANSGLPDQSVSCFARNSADVFAGSSRGVFLSTNGSNWTAVNSGLTDTVIRAVAAIGTTVFAGTYVAPSGGSIFVSTDNGSNWTKSTDGLPAAPVNTFKIHTDGSIFAGTDSGVYLSTNYGLSWKSMDPSFSSGTSVSELTTDNDYLYSATNKGSGVWKRPLSEMLPSAATPTEQTASFTLEQNHPNPFTSSTTISFTLAERGFVALDIYDLLGRKVQTLVSRMMDAGSHSVQFDAGDQPVGVYTARLSADGVRREMKMVVGK